MSQKDQYEAPELQEIGEMAEVTQQFGFGIAEAVVAAIQNHFENGNIKGPKFS
jgi:hypothetical protein